MGGGNLSWEALACTGSWWLSTLDLTGVDLALDFYFHHVGTMGSYRKSGDLSWAQTAQQCTFGQKRSFVRTESCLLEPLRHERWDHNSSLQDSSAGAVQCFIHAHRHIPSKAWRATFKGEETPPCSIWMGATLVWRMSHLAGTELCSAY